MIRLAELTDRHVRATNGPHTAATPGRQPVTHEQLQPDNARSVHQDKLALGITDLPSWSCGFDSFRPPQPETAGQRDKADLRLDH